MMDGWKEVRFGEITELIKRGIAPKYVEEGGYIVINQKCIRDGVLSFGDSRLSSKEKKVAKEKFVQIGDVLINSTGTGTLGRTAPVRKLPGATTVDTHVTILRGNEKVDKLFLGYLASHYEPLITLLGKGSTNQIELGASDLKVTKVVIPESKETQRKIASILSAYDDLIENNLKRIKLLEEKAQLTYEEWFVRMKFPGHETTPINKETGLPEGWELVKVGALLAKLKSTKKIKSSEILERGNTPVIDQSRDFIKGYTNELDALIHIYEPIIVFGDHTRILKFIDFNFARGADGTQLVLSKDPRMPQHLFYQVLKGIDLSDYHYARHFKYLKDTEINICDEITANHYEDFAAPLFKAIKEMRDQNKLLKEARDILLPRLMTGMIDVEQMNLETPQPTTV